MRTKNFATMLWGVAAATTALSLAAPTSAQATVSGHGERLLYTVESSSGSQLFTLKADSKRPIQITHVNGEATRGDWSPDGSQIAFELGTPDTANIALIRGDGSGLRVIPSQGDGIDADPSFTPDGQHVVFERFEPATGDDAIWVMRTDGSGRRRVATGPHGAQDPNVSPDGRTLTFVGASGDDDSQQALFAVGMDGTGLRQLTSYSLDVAIKHDWSPDGHHIVLSDNANVDGPANVATVDPDGSHLTYLTHYAARPGSAYVGSYSPDGRWIVYRFEENGQYGLRRMRPDGTDVHTILPLSSVRPRFIDWGPVGSGD